MPPVGMTKSPGRVHLDEIQSVLPAEILHAKFTVSSVALAGWRGWILHRDFLSSCGDADVCGLPCTTTRRSACHTGWGHWRRVGMTNWYAGGLRLAALRHRAHAKVRTPGAEALI